jgi:hypothetical protein
VNAVVYGLLPTPSSSKYINFYILLNYTGSRVGVVGIATRYRLEGLGIESRWGETGSGAHPATCTTDTGSFPVVKAAGA